MTITMMMVYDKNDDDLGGGKARYMGLCWWNMIVIVNSDSDIEYNIDEENVEVQQDTRGGAGEI